MEIGLRNPPEVNRVSLQAGFSTRYIAGTSQPEIDPLTGLTISLIFSRWPRRADPRLREPLNLQVAKLNILAGRIFWSRQIQLDVASGIARVLRVKSRLPVIDDDQVRTIHGDFKSIPHAR